MRRIKFLLTASLFLCALTNKPCRGSQTQEPPGQKPHLILIMTDQHRGDCIGYETNEYIKTPNLDALATEGVLFKNGYSSVPSCTPARAGLLTGQSPWHHGMLGYGRVAESYKYELPRMVRNAGYFTMGIGKMHWYPQRNRHGFHVTLLDESGRAGSPGFVSDYRQWFYQQAPGLNPDSTGIGWNEHRAGVYALSEELHPTAWTGQTAVEVIENYKDPRPLLLKISFARPHSPYDPPGRFLDMYEGAEIPQAFTGDWCREFKDYPDTKSAAFGFFGMEHAVNSRRHYYANITFIDEQIGHIIAALKKKEMYENSLIIFTSDHGDMLGDHHHWRKTYAYQGSAHVPFIMKWPRNYNSTIERGSILDQPVELRDILPTFLDAIGQPVPEDMDGASLLTLVSEKKPTWREYIDMEHNSTYRRENYWAALTDGHQKYIWFFLTGREQLFDLDQDPGELHDLTSDRNFLEDLKKWRQRMVDHLSERGEGFVKSGQLVIRKEPMLYSPNYPGTGKTK